MAGQDARDDPGWYYLNMAASRMITRLSENPTPITTPVQTPSSSVTSPAATPIGSPAASILVSIASDPLVTSAQATNTAVYRSVRSVCGHAARHLPNLWKMGQYYLEGKFDPKNYGANDKGKEEQQAHPLRDDRDKVCFGYLVPRIISPY